MAKKGTANRTEETDPVGRKQPSAGPARSDSMARIRLALAAGNVRRARSLAHAIAATGPDSERFEAAGILDRTRPDPRALITTLIVIAIILFAAWAAIFNAH